MDYNKIPSPTFVLDEVQFRNNLKLIEYIEKKAGIEILLAFKGFSMWSTFPMVIQHINGASASSLNEAKLCFDEMKTRAHLYSPAYSEFQFDELMKYSSHIVFNSFAQYEKFYPLTKNSSHPISCGIRVNPEYSDVKTELYNASSPKSRLGVLKEFFPKKLPDGIEGIHFHVLCESNSFSLEKTLEAFEDRFGAFLHQLKWVNLGGGHLMTHEDYDVDHLIAILKNFRERYKVKVILEPGSAFAWNAGVLVSQVLDVVESHDVKTAMLDISFAAHMPDTLEMPYRPKIINAKEPHKNSKYLYRLGGISCLAGDFLENYDFGKELNIGDKIVFEDMIHYTMVKTTMFNGVTHPAIAIWTESNELNMEKQFSYEDFKGRLS